jgi:hypothetical protein
MTVKLFNQTTGLWFRTGVNFTEECFFHATPLEPQQAAVVKASFDGPIGEHVVGSLVDGLVPECNCGNDCCYDSQY